MWGITQSADGDSSNLFCFYFSLFFLSALICRKYTTWWRFAIVTEDSLYLCEVTVTGVLWSNYLFVLMYKEKYIYIYIYIYGSSYICRAEVMCHVMLEVMVTLWDEAVKVYGTTLGHTGHTAVGFDLRNSCFRKIFHDTSTYLLHLLRSYASSAV